MSDPNEGRTRHASLEDVLITDRLSQRPSRPPDYEGEAKALAALAGVMATAPDTILHGLVDQALTLCGAESSGVSLLLPEQDNAFHWAAVGGAWASHAGADLTRDAAPCGVVIDRDRPLLFDRPGRYFHGGPPVSPAPAEALLVPFHAGGVPIGTVWAVAHSPGREFDAEDVRLLTSLSRFAAAAHQLEERVRARTRELHAANKALRANEEQYRSVFETIDEGFITAELIYDGRGRPVDALYLEGNPAASRLTGGRDYNRRLLSELVPDWEDYWLEIYDRVACSGVAERLERFLAPLDRWYDFHVSRLSSGTRGAQSAPRVAVVFRDVTERNLAEAALRLSGQLNALLVRFSDAARGLSDPALVAKAACRALTGQLGTDLTVWAGIDWASREYVAEWAFAADGTDAAPARWPLDPSEPFAAEHLAGRPVVYDDSEADPRIPQPTRAAMATRGMRSGIAVPVVVDGTLRAVLNTSQQAPRRWRPEEVAFVEALAGRAWAEVERARAEASLRESDVRFRSIANLVPDLLWASRPDGYTDWYNQRWCEYTGQTPEQAVGWGWTDAIHPDDREELARRYGEAVVSERMLVQEHRILRHDGEYRWFLVRAEPVRDEAGRLAMFGSATDIHARHTMMEAIRQSEEKYRTLFESIDEGYLLAEIIRDEAGSPVDLLYLEGNPAASRITGGPSFAGRRLLEIDPGFGDRSLEIWDRVARTGVSERLEHHAAPLARWYDFHVSRVGEPGDRRVAVVFRDITARRQAESAFRRIAGRQAYLLELADALRPIEDPLAIQREASHILRVQLGAIRVGYAEMRPDSRTCTLLAEDVIDEIHSLAGMVFDWDDLDPVALAASREGRTFSREDIRAAGDLTPRMKATFASLDVSAFISTPLVKAGRLVAFFVAQFDSPHRHDPDEVAMVEETAERTWAAVERAKAEEEVRRARDELELRVAGRTAELAAEIERRKDLTRQLGSAQEDERQRVSRDLHDSAGQLLVGLSLALKKVELVGDLPREAVTRLAEAHRMMDALGKELHVLAVRLRPTSLDDLGLVPAVRQLVEVWSDRTGIRAELQTTGLDSTRIGLEAETTIYRVVQEALTNVAKYAHASVVSMIVNRPNRHVTAVIEDNGLGFDPDTIGRGQLGLLGMRERVGLVGGELEIESSPGSGTTIYLRIPLPG